MRKLAVVFSLILIGCSNAAPAVLPTPGATPRSSATLSTAPATSVPAATASNTPAPNSTTAPNTTTAPNSAVDYKAICQPLLLPLGALIVAVRGNTPTTTFWLAEFNKAADKVLPAIEGDESINATRLRTGIANVRAMPNNLQVLEDSRSLLLAIG